MDAILFNIQRFSTEDGPGIRTSLFFQGCPLLCPWCHNPEGMEGTPRVVWQAVHCLRCGECEEACPQGALVRTDEVPTFDREKCAVCGTCVDTCASGSLDLVGRSYSETDLLVEVLKDRTFFEKSGGGITLTGGEPLLQHRFLERFLPLLRQEGVHVALDTGGVASKAAWDSVLPQIDLVLFDLKVSDPEAHRRWVGADLEKMLSGLNRVAGSGLPVWIRTPVIPGATDSLENIRGVAALARDLLPQLARFDLLAFSNLCTSKYEMMGRDFPLSERPLMTARDMDTLSDVVRDVGIENVHWSGPTRIHAGEGSA